MGRELKAFYPVQERYRMKRILPQITNLTGKLEGRKIYRWTFNQRIGAKRNKYRFDMWEPRQIFWDTLQETERLFHNVPLDNGRD